MDGGEKTLSFEGGRLARCWSGCSRGGKIEEKSWEKDEGEELIYLVVVLDPWIFSASLFQCIN
jgi:hypothetical protein